MTNREAKQLEPNTKLYLVYKDPNIICDEEFITVRFIREELGRVYYKPKFANKVFYKTPTGAYLLFDATECCDDAECFFKTRIEAKIQQLKNKCENIKDEVKEKLEALRADYETKCEQVKKQK